MVVVGVVVVEVVVVGTKRLDDILIQRESTM